MIQINATIDLLNGNKVLNDSVSNINIKTPMPVNKKSKGSNAWFIGMSKIGDNASLDDSVENGGNVDYYVEYPNDKIELWFDVRRIFGSYQYIDNFTIVFDTVRNVYPTKMQVDCFDDEGNIVLQELFTLDDAIFTLKLDKKIVSFKIKTYDYLLNKKSNLVIQGVYSGLKINIDKSNLVDMNISHRDRANTDKPAFGVISNNGSISFIDTDGEIKDYIESKILQSNQDVTIKIIDTLSGNENIVGKYLTSRWEYDNDNRQVFVELKEDLLIWQDMLIEDMPLSEQSKTMNDILKYLINKSVIISPSFNPDYEAPIIRQIVLKYPYLNKSNLWNEFQKVCDACGLHIYKKVNGEMAIVGDYEYGN